MKKLFTLFVALFATIALWAQEAIRIQAGDLYYDLYYNYASDEYGNLYQDYTHASVTYEEYWSENNYASLTSVTIPDSITYEGGEVSCDKH